MLLMRENFLLVDPLLPGCAGFISIPVNKYEKKKKLLLLLLLCVVRIHCTLLVNFL
jgi:hypothetical protein